MKTRRPLAQIRSSAALLLPLMALLSGCTRDGITDPTGSQQTWPTHHEVSLQMSSINAVENCEVDPGNPGEFKYSLIVTRKEADGSSTEVGRYHSGVSKLHDGDILGMDMPPITFLMPIESGARFVVEYEIAEYDGNTANFRKHSWSTHIYDRDPVQEWQAGTDYESYGERDGETYGLLKFTTWSESDFCKGAARYFVTWKPVTP